MNFHFQLILIFFGLDSSFKELQLEQIYILVKHLGFNYRDARCLNVAYRKWFIDRYVKELKEINEKRSGGSDVNQDVNNDNISNLRQYESLLNKKFSNDI
jgi:uncharacterized protein (UPF0305 family)